MECVSGLVSQLCGLGLDAAKKVWDCNANIERLENMAPNIQAKVNAFSEHKQQNPGFMFSEAAEECLERVRTWNSKAQGLLGSRNNRIWNPVRRYKRSGKIMECISPYQDLLSQIESHGHELNVDIAMLEKGGASIQALLNKFHTHKHRNPEFRYSDGAEECLDHVTKWNDKAQALLGSQEKRYGEISKLIHSYEGDLVPKMERYEREELRVIQPSTSFAVRSSPQDRGPAKKYVRRGVPDAMFGGHEQLLDEVVNALLDPEARSKWVGLLGMGGCGKTTLASCAHNDERVREHFHDNIVWITVKKDASEDDLKAQLLNALEWGEMKERARGTLDDMKHLARDVAGGNRVLLVLDDVWDRSWAKELDFIAGPSSGRILVTTRKEGILHPDAKAFPVHELSMDESKKMFWKFAFGVHDPQPGVVEVAEKIARKCEGLPLALEVIGSAMAVHRSEGPQVWEERYKRLHLSNDPDVEKQMFKRLKFSYDELGNAEDEKLQECFLYVAAFPEDRSIGLTELRKCWMEVGSELSPTAIVNELERRCLVKIRKHPITDFIIVHDMLRKLCIRILKGKYSPQQEHEKGCLFGYDWTSGIQNATFAKVSFISKNVGSFLSDNHVRDVILLDKCKELSNVDDSLINHIQGVKVLSLWRCSKIHSIPESISKLKNLQLLDIRETNVRQLPDALFSLTSLKFLKCTRWRPTKCNIALLPQLSNLEELELRLDSKEESSVVDLTGISRKLRHLRMTHGTMKVPESMGTLEHIETLVLHANNIDFATFVGLWQLVNLTKCQIHVETLSRAAWKRMFMKSIKLQHFSIVGVEDSENSDDSFEWLQLRYLDIRDIINLSWLFHRLETLFINCNRIHFFNLDGSFPRLGDLSLTNLQIAQSEFKDDLAASLPNLKELGFELAPDIEWEHLPLFVTQLPNRLESLRITGCIKRLLLPTERSSLKVERLSVSSRKMQNDFFEPSDQMTDIEIVHFDETIIPSSIASLPSDQMTDIKIVHFDETIIPSSIASLPSDQMTDIEIVHLSCDETIIPSSIASLPGLKFLDISGPSVIQNDALWSHNKSQAGIAILPERHENSTLA
ncbi:probable disease resistance protein At1g61180 [Selaginella moellendorffii]|uniref:probable disease resistance protein At1g61180 n=1 Tax=Selaginella moellendorffii TaxID=88036 RepID=UPI000D1CDC1C|nr:probable disease resistance protein At1g61180 [Selaginella moellendorffii]|eukprot:XP_024534441.1 probable disease resistance protein At1g61180 [Selaginella moellendorffii]